MASGRQKKRTVDGEERASAREAVDYHPTTSNCLYPIPRPVHRVLKRGFGRIQSAGDLGDEF